tara:strand:- start:2709 stop:2873 length:165 start_codon:yes stop_codon:yes gene_type:complete
MDLARRTGDEYGGRYVVHLADFVLNKFPDHMRACIASLWPKDGAGPVPLVGTSR